MATKRKTATTANNKASASSTHLPPTGAADVKNAAAPFLSATGAVRKYPGRVTVYYNHPRSIIFKVTDSHGVEQSVLINGNATNLRGLPKGILPAAGTFGRTADVDGELWEAVEAKYKNMPIFRNGLIFAVSTEDAAKAELRDRRGPRNGHEPIDPTRARTEPDKDKD